VDKNEPIYPQVCIFCFWFHRSEDSEVVNNRWTIDLNLGREIRQSSHQNRRLNCSINRRFWWLLWGIFLPIFKSIGFTFFLTITRHQYDESPTILFQRSASSSIDPQSCPVLPSVRNYVY
jgi:hypothetical protein